MRKASKLAVVVPTFNEADNIAPLIKSINTQITKDDQIVIVDDNSPDGTAKVARHLRIKNLHVILRRKKSGRGSAVLAGFRYGKKFDPDYYLEMDADFSHKPQDIPRLLKKAIKGADVVIGSRYLEKSRVYNWSFKRKIFSRLANFYAKLILNVPISDYTNGFRIYSKKAVLFLMSQKFRAKGYVLLSETAYKLRNAGFVFAEIPVVFVNRERGISNLNFNEIKNAFLGVLEVRFSLPESFESNQ